MMMLESPLTIHNNKVGDTLLTPNKNIPRNSGEACLRKFMQAVSRLTTCRIEIICFFMQKYSLIPLNEAVDGTKKGCVCST